MAGKSRPYEQYGPYILLKRLEADAFGELHRAMRLQNGGGAVVALRVIRGGNAEALAAAATAAHQITPSLTGPTFVKDQRIEMINGSVALSYDYTPGRSLRTIVDRARGQSSQAQPIPIDQAIAIAERVALSLATTAELRFGGERLVHGGLIPQFIWITEDGEIRVAGQQLGKGLAASLRDEKIAAEIGRYFAPEAQHSGEASKSTEVYALGAILYLLITGHEPPDATRTSAFTHAVRATKTMAGTPMPDDIRAILEKSLNIDPAGRFASPGDMHAALSALSANGKYTATSFNLAFYLTTLLKKEMEAEAAERERESKINVAAYAAEPDEPSAAVPAAAATGIERKRSKVPVAVAATLLIAVAGAGAWFVLGSKQQDAHAASAVQAASALPVPVQKAPVPIPEPIVASPEPAEPAAAEPVEPVTQSQAAVDEAAQKKAFDDAVKRRLQQELLKLQAEYTRQLQAQQARNAPVLSTQAPQTIAETAERPAVSASELDLRRREIARAEDMTASLAQQTVTTAPPQTASVAPPAATTATTATVPPAATQTVPPPVAARATREGDVVDMSELDQLPTPVREPRPMYPPIAARQRIEATIMASLLISETGDVLEVKILRGEQRFGFNDAAIRAFRSARYTSPMKDGKRVRTWVAQMIQFKP